MSGGSAITSCERSRGGGGNDAERAKPLLKPYVEKRMTHEIIASCLFVDPGPTRSAYAHVVALPSGQPLVRGAWYVEHDHVRLWGFLDTLLRDTSHLPRDLVSFTVETIRGEIYQGRSAAQLLETKEVEGRIKEAASIHGVRYNEVAAPEWRKTLVGNGQASNAQIRAAVRGIFGADLQRFRATEDEHILDGIGGALVVLARLLTSPSSPLSPSAKRDLGQRLLIPGGLLPRGVQIEVGKVQLVERQERAAKKQAKAAGVKLPRKPVRRRTRAQERAAVESGMETKRKRREGRL